MKEIYKNKIDALKLQKKQEQMKVDSAKTEEELRSIVDSVKNIDAQIATITEIADADDAEERAKKTPDNDAYFQAQPPVQGTEMRNVGSFKAEQRSEEGESLEYRKAFRDYVMKGTPIPVEFRQTTSTEDTGAAIPMTIMNDVINTVRKRYGNLYAKVRKLSVQGGVEYPIGALKASFKWISESTVSPRQKMDKLGKIMFGYHTAEIRVSQTFLANLLTLSSFETRIAEAIAIAYLEAMDYGIVNGSGDGCMTGILNDPRVTNTITMTAADIADWKKWRSKFFAKLPLGYRSGEFIFAAGTVDAYLETMSDSNGNPIFRQATGLEVNDGDSRNPNGRFFGRNISLVEDDIIPAFDDASQNDVIGIFWQPNEYAINENFGFTMIRYFDRETNEWVDKALVVVDGKVLNPTGIYKIVKG
jgi:HK97 family phage major capsid protein